MDILESVGPAGAFDSGNVSTKAAQGQMEVGMICVEMPVADR